ncbi:E3 ubiquitin-protein ligase MARCH7 isoform X2 [Corythoichthys intestinalis]|uniref:E3 ubiquitin-protein ligase MARCH7 isoform X2 n=1 Tax=Corythoichthys intestinalis TaxID=161448 RepID=UPI0025A63CF0|nr:E3 ubiquitin-protein ligase MARCH7 isoform X2 [Corythoichthys intestinalis]
MDSRSLGLPFSLSASKSSRASTSGSASSSSLSSWGSNRSYSRETQSHHDRFPRASSYKTDVDVMSSGFRSSSRDYGTSDSYSSNWKLRSSLALSGRSCESPLAEPAVGRSKLKDLDANYGLNSVFTNIDDGENKRAKVTYRNRGLYPTTSSTSLAGSLYSSSGLTNVRGVTEKHSEPPESSWISKRFPPRSSASASRPLASLRRESETRTEPALPGLRERPTRIHELTSSLYQTERLTSAYAQGARPKDPSYSSYGLTTARESAPAGHVAAPRFSASRDYSVRPSSTSFSNASYGRTSPEEVPSSRRAEAPPPPRRDSEGRRLLSALLLSRAGRDSSSSGGSSDSDEVENANEPDREAASGGWHGAPARSGGNSGPSLPSCLQRREERTLRLPQHLLRRWDDLERRTPRSDDDIEERRGAAASDRSEEPRPREPEEDRSPRTKENLVDLMLRRRVTRIQNAVAENSQGCADTQQEKLRLIKERLLLEDSDEDEGDLCRICQMGEASASNPLIQPCRCTGSLQYVHQDCIKRWLCSKIGSGTNLEGITNCELCKEKLRLNIDNFDIQQLYRTRAQSDYDNFISSGLYLVVLLQFFEQRFSDVLGAIDAAGLFNLVRILPEQMENLENAGPQEEPDGRPSIDFSDLDDDLDEEY